MYDWLLSPPLRTLPETVNSLLIVPDGVLGYIPFEVLGQSQGRVDFSSFSYLLRRFTVSYASSGNLLLTENRIARQPKEGLAPFAGFAPQYSGKEGAARLIHANPLQLQRDSLPNLPGAIHEVQEIADSLKGDAFLGLEGSEEIFKSKAAGYRILHLAMHAYLEDRNPLFSKMLFTLTPGDPTDDGDLYASELYAMRLPAEMAVLSACQTGLGTLRRGEGIESLSRAFANAGVPSTVVSLWSVSDAATSTIMIDFYKNLKAGLRKDQALQAAKTKYLKGVSGLSASPYFWAGFVASGEMGALY